MKRNTSNIKRHTSNFYTFPSISTSFHRVPFPLVSVSLSHIWVGSLRGF